MGFQGGKCLKVGFSVCGEREDPGHTFFIAVDFATLGSVKTPTYGKYNQLLREIWVGTDTSLASFHVLEVHSDFRCDTFTESQVGSSDLM